MANITFMSGWLCSFELIATLTTQIPWASSNDSFHLALYRFALELILPHSGRSVTHPHL